MLPDVGLFMMTQGPHYELAHRKGPPGAGGSAWISALKPPQVPCRFESLCLLSRIFRALLPSADSTRCFLSVSASKRSSLFSNLS